MYIIESCCETPLKAIVCPKKTVFGCHWLCGGGRGAVPGLRTCWGFFS